MNFPDTPRAEKFTSKERLRQRHVCYTPSSSPFRFWANQPVPTMPDFFDYSHIVAPDEIDAQGHVHNLRYLQWTLWAAGAHTRAGGWNSKQALEQKLGWVVRNHDITYRAAAMEGDAVTIRTWVSEIAKFASSRKYLICRSADETILAKVDTRWVYVDLSKPKVIAIPEELKTQLSICDPAPKPPWVTNQ